MACRLDNPGTDGATSIGATATVGRSALTGLIGSVTRALQLQFSPQRKAEFIAELRRAQTDIDAFLVRSEATLSPSCRGLLLRLSTALEGRLIAVSTRAQRKLVHDRLAEHRAAMASPKVRLP